MTQFSMAQESKRREENIEGEFFVDSSCIDCDTCRWMAPETYKQINEQAAVYHQPETDDEKVRAMRALISCPTASIGYLAKDIDIKKVQEDFPLLIEDNVYHCGYHSEKSFGAASYFIKRPDGNVLVDSPRFTPALVKNLEEMGGIKYMFLTHKDDVADHQKFHDHFGCKRIIHEKELCKSIPKAEEVIDVMHPVKFDESDDELVAIPTPGHTEGHMVLNYRKYFLFSGDHIAYSASMNQLYAFRNYCQFSWEKQIESVEKLIEYYWWWLLPGHGRRIKANPGAFKLHVEKCFDWMKTV